MKLAQFKYLEYGVITVGNESLERCGDYIRLSEYKDVEFDELSKDDVVNAEISVIDSKIKDVNLDAHKKTSELEQRKVELLAIPDMSNE